ncbi:MAG: pyruvate dehydrogenase complex dihydrolipoamide acetyltransferase [Balneolaceae bacterium]|nr:pyruvate dehydrogenase complex dihydrolipoamide acetyltransferase [Balneolaceae bacterium]
MAEKIEMPKLSDTMEEGVIAKWNVKEGDKVDRGDIIAEVETDKATMEVEVFDAGTVLKILADEGEAVPLGRPMAIIGEEDEDISDMLEEIESQKGTAAGEKKEEQEKEAKKEGEKEETVEKAEEEKAKPEERKEKPTKEEERFATIIGGLEGNGEQRIKASPLARKMAEDRGIELSRVEGSGPEGRIIKRDIESYEPTARTAAAAETTREDKEIRVSQMRKTIARRLGESKYTSPHYYETVDIDVENLVAARNQVNDSIEGKISFNDIIVKAAAMALRGHPMINSSWKEDTILQHGDIHVAFAVAVEEGLLTPVIRNTDQKGLRQISKESRELAEKARNKKLQPDQMEGSTFTVSNLGMYNIESFTAIINPPNACILAVGTIRDVPVVKNGEVVPGKRMKMTLSSDHRIVDGVTAAEFLETLSSYLQNPLAMLL